MPTSYKPMGALPCPICALGWLESACPCGIQARPYRNAGMIAFFSPLCRTWWISPRTEISSASLTYIKHTVRCQQKRWVVRVQINAQYVVVEDSGRQPITELEEDWCTCREGHALGDVRGPLGGPEANVGQNCAILQMHLDAGSGLERIPRIVQAFDESQAYNISLFSVWIILAVTVLSFPECHFYNCARLVNSLRVLSCILPQPHRHLYPLDKQNHIQPEFFSFPFASICTLNFCQARSLLCYCLFLLDLRFCKKSVYTSRGR